MYLEVLDALLYVLEGVRAGLWIIPCSVLAPWIFNLYLDSLHMFMCVCSFAVLSAPLPMIASLQLSATDVSA